MEVMNRHLDKYDEEMNKQLRFITETAVMLALLVALQALTKPAGQFVTGSFVNAVLALFRKFIYIYQNHICLFAGFAKGNIFILC